jgi:hypothetical protein
MMVVLQFLKDFPSAPLAAQCRDAVDLVLALHENSFGLVAGAEAPEPTRRITSGGSETWRLFFNLRKQAWQAAGLDPSRIWSRRETVPLCMAAMRGLLTNESITERFKADDPTRDLIRQQDEQFPREESSVQSQIDALLDNEGDWPYSAILW